MMTPKQEIERLEALLNGKTVDGLKLNDPGLDYQWAIQRIADLLDLYRAKRVKQAMRSFCKTAKNPVL